MKSKIRKIVIRDKEYIWSVTEIDWDKVQLKIWLSGQKKYPWITINCEFHNPWDLIGQVTRENIENFQLKPITPKDVGNIIELALTEFGEVGVVTKSMSLMFNDAGKLVRC